MGGGQVRSGRRWRRLHSIQPEVLRTSNPRILQPEERLGKHDAADLEILVRKHRRSPVMRDALPHLIERANTARHAKCFSRQVDWKLMEANEGAAAGDEIHRRVELEQQRFARLKSLEAGLRRRPPEVHLLHVTA